MILYLFGLVTRWDWPSSIRADPDQQPGLRAPHARRLDETIRGPESGTLVTPQNAMAHLEGLLEGLREAISGRIAAS